MPLERSRLGMVLIEGTLVLHLATRTMSDKEIAESNIGELVLVGIMKVRATINVTV